MCLKDDTVLKNDFPNLPLWDSFATNREASSNQRVIFEETEDCLQRVLICGHWIRHSSANGCPLYIVYYYEVL